MINSAARSQLSGKKWYRNISAGNPLYSEMELISTTLITSNTASVTFDVTGLGSSYKHLQIRSVSRCTSSGDDSIKIKMNNDGGANYSFHQITNSGAGVGSLGVANETGLFPVGCVGANSDANIYSQGIIDILDAFSTTKNKTVRGFSAMNVAAPSVLFRSGAWYSTAALTSLVLLANSGSLVAGSRFSLYGIKG